MAIVGLLQDIKACYSLTERKSKDVEISQKIPSSPVTKDTKKMQQLMIENKLVQTPKKLIAHPEEEAPRVSQPEPTKRQVSTPVKSSPSKPTTTVSPQLVVEVSDWLKQLGVTVLPSTLQKPVLEEFRDGWLLCRIVEILEHKVIEGLTKNAKSPAQWLHNLNKVLDVLKQRKVLYNLNKNNLLIF